LFDLDWFAVDDLGAHIKLLVTSFAVENQLADGLVLQRCDFEACCFRWDLRKEVTILGNLARI
jgi:hypothetical protein